MGVCVCAGSANTVEFKVGTEGDSTKEANESDVIIYYFFRTASHNILIRGTYISLSLSLSLNMTLYVYKYDHVSPVIDNNPNHPNI